MTLIKHIVDKNEIELEKIYFIEDGIEYYFKNNENPNEPILIIHGILSHPKNLKVLIDEIKTKNCYAIILFNHGKIKEKLKDIKIEKFLDHIDRFITIKKLTNLTIIAHSFGGLLTLLLLEKLNQKIKKIIFVAPLIPSWLTFSKLFLIGKKGFNEEIKNLSLIKIKKRIKREILFFRMMFKYHSKKYQKLWRFFCLRVIKMQYVLFSKNYELNFQKMLEANQKLKKIPILCIQGELFDWLTPNVETTQFLKKNFTNLKIVKISNSRHIPFWTNKDEFNKVVLNELTKN